ncbi:MAG TPA: hypothetical protein VH307_13265 [Streptosporangiaceae bacterium]|jgi:NAD(P)-dependent dehydrogenase (short-subunit alcohol dehydrogenase family)|nr:hypothetical protein [Streptosporangiaceae bacterium]
MSTAHSGKGGSIVTIASVAARAPADAKGVIPYEVSWLVSPEASSVTGSDITVLGGR